MFCYSNSDTFTCTSAFYNIVDSLKAIKNKLFTTISDDLPTNRSFAKIFLIQIGKKSFSRWFERQKSFCIWKLNIGARKPSPPFHCVSYKRFKDLTAARYKGIVAGIRVGRRGGGGKRLNVSVAGWFRRAAEAVALRRRFIYRPQPLSYHVCFDDDDLSSPH